MRVFIAEPDFFPPLDFFYGLFNSEVWFVVDHVPYKIRSHHNRCRIKTPWGVQLLAIGVQRPCNKILSETVVDNSLAWRRIFLKVLRRSYEKAPYFFDYFDDLTILVNSPHVLLENFNVDAIKWLSKLMGFDLNLFYTKYMIPPPSMVDLKSKIAQSLNATVFDLPYHQPAYQQLSSYKEGMSVLDALFCTGIEKTKSMISSQTSEQLLSSPTQKH